MASKRSVKANPRASKPTANSKFSPLSSAPSIKPPSGEVSPGDAERKSPLKIRFAKGSAGFEPKSMPAKKEPKTSKRKAAEMSNDPEVTPDTAKAAPTKKSKSSKVTAAPKASANEDLSGTTSASPAKAKKLSRRATTAADKDMEASAKPNATVADSPGASNAADAAQANGSKERSGSINPVNASHNSRSATTNASDNKGGKASEKASAAGAKSGEAPKKATAADDASSKKSSQAKSSSSDVSSKSASDQPAGGDNKEPPKTPPTQPTTGPKEPVDSKANGNSSPPGRKRSREEGGVVWDTLQVSLNQEERSPKRARPNRPVTKYTSVLDVLPSKKEIADAAITFPDNDVNLAGEMKDEMQKRRLKAEMEFLLSLPPVSEFNLRAQ